MFLFAEQIKKYLCLSVCLPACLAVSQSQILMRGYFAQCLADGLGGCIIDSNSGNSGNISNGVLTV